MKEKVLQAMREFGAPVNAGKIAEITGIDRKEVDKAFAELKKEGAIVSPVRCKWEPAWTIKNFEFWIDRYSCVSSVASDQRSSARIAAIKK